ncbi:MAG: lipocalin family protein [Chthoniobacterales bacterium]
MRATIPTLSLLIGTLPIAAQGEKPGESPLVGTWCWRNIRHNLDITFKANGTYKQTYALASDEANVHPDEGTWSLEDSTLIMTSSKKGSEPTSSSINFVGEDKVELDGFQIYDRIPCD